MRKTLWWCALVACIGWTGCGSSSEEDESDGTGGSGGRSTQLTCADCVGIDITWPGNPATVTTACAETDDPHACECEDGMGHSTTIYLSKVGCM